VPPGDSVPTLRAVQGIVHALSVYASTFTVATVPLRDIFRESLRAPRVVIVTSSPVMAIMTIAGEIFCAILFTKA
jgi:hypothetical protein